MGLMRTEQTFREAVVVCTRNRPDDVKRLMQSLGKQDAADQFLVAVVDASDPNLSQRVRETVESAAGVAATYLPYPDKPSLARQRNFGTERLPHGVEIVHFLDDDVSLEPGYLRILTSVLDAEPDAGGVGGVVIPSTESPARGPFRQWVSRFFLLESRQPGKVLPSGGLTGAQSQPLENRIDVECLGGCATYRRELIERLRFDDRLEGYSMDEDLDFSYRIGRIARLAVEPRARLVHHLSSANRQSIRESRRDLIVYRYWFIEKNLRHPFKKPAYWWKVFGSYLMASLSRNPDAREARKGITEGVSIVLRRAHPLL